MANRLDHITRLAWVLGLLAFGSRAAEPGVPAWLYPSNSPLVAPSDTPGDAPIHLPGSTESYTQAQLTDLFSAPDWKLHPHDPMPAIVAQGRRPDIRACGFCHTPTGQGRPENASLAGLPRAYVVAQLQSFRDGTRRAAWPGSYGPADLMILAAQRLTGAEIEASAAYFARQHLVARTAIRESADVPRARVVGLVYVALPDQGEEPLGARLLEFTPDARRHEQRDDAMRYVTFVPPGSVALGKALATQGRPQQGVAACTSCHGADLRGLGVVPGLRGRSPTYLLRSLYAFRLGARHAPAAAPMQALSAQLTAADLIDAAAYAGSLQP